MVWRKFLSSEKNARNLFAEQGRYGIARHGWLLAVCLQVLPPWSVHESAMGKFGSLLCRATGAREEKGRQRRVDELPPLQYSKLSTIRQTTRNEQRRRNTTCDTPMCFSSRFDNLFRRRSLFHRFPPSMRSFVGWKYSRNGSGRSADTFDMPEHAAQFAGNCTECWSWILHIIDENHGTAVNGE